MTSADGKGLSDRMLAAQRYWDLTVFQFTGLSDDELEGMTIQISGTGQNTGDKYVGPKEGLEDAIAEGAAAQACKTEVTR